MADQSITMATGGSLDGRALARIGAVTMASNTVTRPDLVVSIAGRTRMPSARPFTISQSMQYLNAAFAVPASGKTTLKLFNSSGRQVATLFNAQAEAGITNLVRFKTSRLPRGLYISKFQSSSDIRLQRIVLGR